MRSTEFASSGSGQTYQVYFATNLLTGFVPLSGVVTAAAPAATYLDTQATNDSRAYRVKIWP